MNARMVPCRVCGGDGLITLQYGERETYRPCSACNGSGRVEVEITDTPAARPRAEACLRIARQALAAAVENEATHDIVYADVMGDVAACAVEAAIQIVECPI